MTNEIASSPEPNNDPVTAESADSGSIGNGSIDGGSAGNGSADPESYTYSPAEAIRIIENAPDQTLLLDLDLTLVLGPTTEAFLDSARPSSYAKIILAILNKLAPWRILPGGHHNGDWVRVLAVLILVPWSYFRWRSVATSWTQNNINPNLVEAVRNHRGRVVVITRGFSSIVNPVVDELRLKDEKTLTIACNAWRWRGHRQYSKTEHVERNSQLATASDSILVSDSIDDRDLFDVCDTAVLTEWEGAYWITPHQHAYVPLQYVQRTKNPRGGFVRAAWTTDDLYIALLAVSLTAWAAPIHAIGITLFSFALWITYETGYYENDMLGSVRETDPVLPDNFADVAGSLPTYAPWVWATALTVLGSPFVAFGANRPLSDVAPIALGWIGVLVFVRVVFALFNRLPKFHRVIPHLFLQVGKYFGYLVVTASTPLGAVLLASQVAYRWVPYVPYRWSKKRTFSPQPLHRTRIFVFGSLAIPSLIFLDHSWGQIVLFVLATLLLGKRAVKNLF